MSWGVAKFDAGGSLLFDLAKLVLQANTVPGEAKIFVRGFADSCKNSPNCGIGNLVAIDKHKYYYEHVDVYPTVNATDTWNKENQGFSLSKTISEDSSDGYGKYKNEHLPNLRAKFFVDTFLTHLIKQCSLPNPPKNIGILQGRVDTTAKGKPEARKVEVYIAIYPEKFSHSSLWESIKHKIGFS